MNASQPHQDALTRRSLLGGFGGAAAAAAESPTWTAAELRCDCGQLGCRQYALR